MKYIRNILSAIFLLGVVAAGILFAVQNQDAVPLDLLVYTFEPKSIALWVLGAFCIGGLVGLLASSLMLVRSRASLGAARRQLARARTELEQARAESAKTVA